MTSTWAKFAAGVTVLTKPLVADALPAENVAVLPGATAIGGPEIFNLGTSLVVVVLAIVIFGWLYSRMQGIGNRGSDVINIVASRPLGPKERILLIEIADKQLLVGMTASQVQTLHVFEQPVVKEVESPPPAGFAHRLRSAVREIVQ